MMSGRVLNGMIYENELGHAGLELNSRRVADLRHAPLWTYGLIVQVPVPTQLVSRSNWSRRLWKVVLGWVPPVSGDFSVIGRVRTKSVPTSCAVACSVSRKHAALFNPPVAMPGVTGPTKNASC